MGNSYRAEEVIKRLIKNHDNKRDTDGNLALSTSKLRNILAMTTALKRDAQHIIGEELDDAMQGRVQYIHMRIAYEYGRDNDEAVKDFIEKANLLDEVKNIGTSKEKLLNFCNYIEALTAYHKYYDNVKTDEDKNQRNDNRNNFKGKNRNGK